MLVVNPYYLVYDVGFVMSFTAVIGIILISQAPQTHTENAPSPLTPLLLRGGSYLRKNYLQPSVGATFGVFPIIIFFMGRINLLSVLTNLFVLPLLAIVMIYGFISVYLYQFL